MLKGHLCQKPELLRVRKGAANGVIIELCNVYHWPHASNLMLSCSRHCFICAQHWGQMIDSLEISYCFYLFVLFCCCFSFVFVLA